MNSTLRRLGLRLWQSPALMSWGSLGVRGLGFLLLLPLLLRWLRAEELALWFLFLGLLALQGLADFGFAPTFMRAVAYARARPGDAGALDAVVRTMRFVYARLTLAGLVLVCAAGALVLSRPIAQLGDPGQAWLAAALMALAGGFTQRTLMYSSCLQGAERIEVYRRIEIVVGLAVTVGSALVLVAGGGILGIASVHLAGAVAASEANRQAAMRVASPDAWRGRAAPDPGVLGSIVPPAWRSGLGVLLNQGAIQGSGLVYAQLAAPAEVAAYLLALRVMQVWSEVAGVPFYTRLPGLARMYAEGRSAELAASAARGMLGANWLLVAGVIALAVAGAPLLEAIGSRTPFVAPAVWWMLATAILVERIGAMHLQLYSTTNHVVWHIANGIAGVLMILAMPPAYLSLGLPGLPLGMLLGYAAFYTPFSMACSYRAFSLSPLRVDLAASATPLAVMAAGLALAW